MKRIDTVNAPGATGPCSQALAARRLVDPAMGTMPDAGTDEG